MDDDGREAERGRTERVDAVIELLRSGEQRSYIGEPVSQLAHALQSAHFGRIADAAPAEIIAALLHDVGHLCAGPEVSVASDLGVVHHDVVGAQYLRDLGFGGDVTDLVGGHVEAKRYLTWKNPAYFDRLSAASRKTLALQGGPMTRDEATAFERCGRLRSILRVRRWDELGKEVGLTVAGLDTYRALLIDYLAATLPPTR